MSADKKYQLRRKDDKLLGDKKLAETILDLKEKIGRLERQVFVGSEDRDLLSAGLRHSMMSYISPGYQAPTLRAEVEGLQGELRKLREANEKSTAWKKRLKKWFTLKKRLDPCDEEDDE